MLPMNKFIGLLATIMGIVWFAKIDLGRLGPMLSAGIMIAIGCLALAKEWETSIDRIVKNKIVNAAMDSEAKKKLKESDGD